MGIFLSYGNAGNRNVRAASVLKCLCSFLAPLHTSSLGWMLLLKQSLQLWEPGVQKQALGFHLSYLAPTLYTSCSVKVAGLQFGQTGTPLCS